MPAGPIFINTAIARREALILIKPPYLPPRRRGGYLDSKWHPSAEAAGGERAGAGRWAGWATGSPTPGGAPPARPRGPGTPLWAPGSLAA